jgi:hypothetical protein
MRRHTNRIRWRPLAAVLILLVVWPAAAWADGACLWRVDQGGETAWLLGSIHMLRPSDYPLDPVIRDAFNRSDGLVVEADVERAGPELVTETMNRAMLEGDKTLTDVLSPRTVDRLEDTDLDLTPFMLVEPWLVASVLEVQKLQSLGFDLENGLDVHFIRLAKERDMPIEELEGIEYQLDLFDSLSLEEQDDYLYYLLLKLDRMESEMDRLVAAWKRGRTQVLERLLLGELAEHPELEPIVEKLIHRRNETMADRIEALMADGRTWFVVAGAGHMIGERGIPALLEKRGFGVTQAGAGQ